MQTDIDMRKHTHTYVLILTHIIVYSFRVFQISVSWWSFTGVEWQQVSFCVPYFSPYSRCSQQCCSLEGLHSSSNFKVFSLSNDPLLTVPKAPITIDIILTFMFHSFFNSLARSRYWFFFSLYFSFILWLAVTAKSTILQILFFFFCGWL